MKPIVKIIILILSLNISILCQEISDSSYKYLSLDTTGIPVSFRLYPVEYNHTFSGYYIKFDIPNSSELSLSFSDLKGNMIDSFYYKSVEPGRYKFDYSFFWNKVSAGAYYYKVVAGNFNLSEKLPIIKEPSDSAYKYLSSGGKGIPDSCRLGQNYPNPFSPTTYFTFGVPKKTPVSISFYDINGDEIDSVFYKVLEPGKYRFDYGYLFIRLKSGVYFYKVVAGECSDIKKMILVK